MAHILPLPTLLTENIILDHLTGLCKQLNLMPSKILSDSHGIITRKELSVTDVYNAVIKLISLNQ